MACSFLWRTAGYKHVSGRLCDHLDTVFLGFSLPSRECWYGAQVPTWRYMFLQCSRIKSVTNPCLRRPPLCLQIIQLTSYRKRGIPYAAVWSHTLTLQRRQFLVTSIRRTAWWPSYKAMLPPPPPINKASFTSFLAFPFYPISSYSFLPHCLFSCFRGWIHGIYSSQVFLGYKNQISQQWGTGNSYSWVVANVRARILPQWNYFK